MLRSPPVDVYRQLLQLLGSDETPQSFHDQINEIWKAIGQDKLPPSMADDVMAIISVRERFNSQLMREKELSALYETARDLSALRNTDQVLQAIVGRAKQLVGCDIGYFTVADNQRNEFYVKATEGVFSQEFSEITLPSNIGVFGSIIRTKKAYYSSNYTEDHNFPHDPSIDLAMEREGIKSIMGIPLEVRGQVIGALFVGDRYVRVYTPQETAVLSSLGTFAAVAIENARLFEETDRALRRARDANDALESRARAVERAAEAHEQLTELVASGGSIEDLTTRLANLLQGKCAVLDVHFNVIGGELPENIDPEELKRVILEKDCDGRSAQVQCDDGDIALVANAVGGSARLGSLMVKGNVEFSAPELRTFERCAIVTAIVLLSRERVAQAAQRDVVDAIRALVRGVADPFASASAKQHPNSKSLSWPLTLMVMDLYDVPFRNISSDIQAAVLETQTIFAEFDGNLVVITSDRSPEDLASRIATKVRRLFEAKPNIVISSLIPSIEKTPTEYDSIRRCLQLLHSLNQHGRITYEKPLSMYAVLFNGEGVDAVGAFIRASIGSIIDRDAKRGSQLAETLLAYLDGGRNIKRASRQLGIHVNTLRQRLDTIHDIKPDSLKADRCLEIHIALRLHLLNNKK